jgi:hypothetical protein
MFECGWTADVDCVLALPEGTIPLSAERIASMPDRLSKELEEVGAVLPLKAVWGRRPLT